MITDVILFVVGLFIWTISKLFGLIEYAIPDTVETAVNQIFDYVRSVNGLLPMLPDSDLSGFASTIGLLTIGGYMLQFIVAWYLIKLILFVFALIPWFGKHVEIPKGKTMSDIRSGLGSHNIDLRK